MMDRSGTKPAATEKQQSNKNKPSKKQYSAPALEKGLDILELLSTELNGLNITDITSRLNRTVGEVFRMIAVLEQRGYLELPQGSDRYRTTIKLFRLANQFPPAKRLAAIAGPIMQNLAFIIEQSCHLVIYYEGKGHVVVQQDSLSDRSFSVKLGTEVALVNTCSGHVLLAFSVEQVRAMMIKKIPEHHPKYDHSRFEKNAKKIKKQGYESIKSQQIQGVKDIGFPVFDEKSEVVAALVVPFLSYLDDSHPVDFNKAKKSIEAAAKEMSSLIGYMSE